MIQFNSFTLALKEGHQPVFLKAPLSLDDMVEFFAANPIIAALVHLMVLDIISGISAGAIAGKLSSTVSFKGMVAKGLMLGMVAAARIMESIIVGFPWGQAMALFFCVTEAISITENAGLCGVPIPQQWKEALEKLKEKKESKGHGVNVETKVEIHTEPTNIDTDTGEVSQDKYAYRKRPSDVVVLTDGQILNPEDVLPPKENPPAKKE